MIRALIGKIHKLDTMAVEFNVQDTIYEIHISVQTSSRLRALLESSAASISQSTQVDSGKIELLITHIIREDAQLLFGFLDPLERSTFERLLKINGVGTKVALTILSTFSAKQFLEIIASKDIKLLQKVPGVGAKSAGKILLDLAGFCKEVLESSASPTSPVSVPNVPSSHEITSALESLGYKTTEIKRILPQIQATDTQSAIKEALRLLSR
ncbi:Holliday junction branch migration protein RuvA [uncultured Helicobacter sp.]|uniref:Holliday junction branch migration protein RuvA n=1 Tax=uncultured Helicobacter sp. TaxID=175537 RepID=UPI00261B5176|nr:Holliday junction branch migration protein RuvA [uncultured Helicobacter sp.]